MSAPAVVLASTDAELICWGQVMIFLSDRCCQAPAVRYSPSSAHATRGIVRPQIAKHRSWTCR